MEVKVTTVIHKWGGDYKPRKYATYQLIDDNEKKSSTTTLSFKETKTAKIYNSIDDKVVDKNTVLSTCAHEFGHVIGLADLYGYEGNYYIRPVVTNKTKEIMFKAGVHAGDKTSNSMMYMSGTVNANEIELVIYAAKEKNLSFLFQKDFQQIRILVKKLSMVFRLQSEENIFIRVLITIMRHQSIKVNNWQKEVIISFIIIKVPNMKKFQEWTKRNSKKNYIWIMKHMLRCTRNAMEKYQMKK